MMQRKGGVYQYSIKWSSREKGTVIDFLQEKHSYSQKTDPIFVVTDLKIRDLQFHTSLFLKN